MSSPINEVVMLCVFAIFGSLNNCCFANSECGVSLQGNMCGAVDKFPIQPVLNPCRVLVVIFYDTFFFLKKRIIHVAFGGGNNQFELLISAAVDVLAGMVMRNVVVDVLSEPKSSTAIDLLP